MKRLFIALALLPLLVFNCHESSNSGLVSENVLLAKEVQVSSPHIIDNEQNPEWTASFDHKSFFDTLFSRAVNNRVKVYVIRSADFEDVELAEEMLKDEIIAKTTLNMEGGIIKSVKEILFYEKWDFNNKRFKFSKEIVGWCPITNWKQEGVEKRQKVFYIYPKGNTKGKKIAESIIYEIPWYFEYPTTNVGFDKKAFFKYLIDGINAGTIDAWDPIYLVDKSKRKFRPEELATYIGQELNPGKIEFSMGSMLFEEDWYFDEKAYPFKKR
jgi:hypothetical protein